MRINVFIDEIEFEEGIEFNFHDRVRIKKAFKRELARLFLDTKNDNNGDFSISNMLNNNNNEIFIRLKSSGNTKFIKEIESGQFYLSFGDINPSQVGKTLAKSIYSSLNLMDNGMMRSSHTTNASEETTNN
jgi:hypothetical protein